MSLRKSAAIGTKSAVHQRRKYVPPNRHIAPMAVKFQGCGMIRVAAAARIMVTSVIARGFSIGSSLLVIFILYGGNRFRSHGHTDGGRDGEKIDIVPIVAADGD